MISMNKNVKYMDTIVKICGYFINGAEVNNGYGCNHPKQEEVDTINGKEHGKCFSYSCPIAIALRPNEYKEDRKYFDKDEWKQLSDGDWLLIHDKDLLSKLKLQEK